MSNPARIKSITVKRLFNQFDHHIDFNQEERITILHGINGVGKTTILRMINNLFNARIYNFNEIPFTTFTVELSNGNQIKVEKKQYKNKNTIKLFFNKESIDYQIFDKKEFLEFIKKLNWIKKINNGVFYDTKSEDVLSTEDLIVRYKNIFLGKSTKDSNAESIVNNRLLTKFIETSRLFGVESLDDLQKNKEFSYTVGFEAYEMKQRFKNIMTEYAKKTQELEQTFPFRLLKASEHYTYEQLKERIEILQNKRNKFKKLGLLPTTDTALLDAGSIDSLEEHHAAVMNLYVKDGEEKLNIFEPLADKIELLLKIINSKFQGKELRIDEKRGLIIIGKDGEIDLTLLSSGEQHELVMFYDLIFKVEPNTLVMIDEPELSLHVTWQNKFINELKQIVEHSEFDVLIATHSSTIIGKNSHLMVRLGVN
ncbi:MAG: AAA family ATPase [Methylococcaceae bacterium]